EVIAPTSELINNRELEIVKLSHIHLPEVKSVLSVKLLAAKQHGIQVMIDIPHPIEEIAMSMVHFIRVISILLDNGIEEAVSSKEKMVQLAFFEKDESQYFVVRNTYQNKAIDLHKIYEKDYSSKEKNRGYGLHSLKQIIDDTAHATLETNFTSSFFTQSFMLKKKD